MPQSDELCNIFMVLKSWAQKGEPREIPEQSFSLEMLRMRNQINTDCKTGPLHKSFISLNLRHRPYGCVHWAVQRSRRSVSSCLGLAWHLLLQHNLWPCKEQMHGMNVVFHLQFKAGWLSNQYFIVYTENNSVYFNDIAVAQRGYSLHLLNTFHMIFPHLETASFPPKMAMFTSKMMISQW
jgi:hypothetical protein